MLHSEVIRAITQRQELRDFAEEIIEVQQRKIREMHEWIGKWYPEEMPHARY